MSNAVWQSLIPVVASIVGWGLAMFGQAVHARRENRREHYYKVLERTEDILARCGGLSDYAYELHKKCVKLANAKEAIVDESILLDFVTSFQSRLASVHLSLRLLYPGIRIDTTAAGVSADELVQSIKEMWELATERRSAVEVARLAERVVANQQRREMVLGSLARELGLMMNIMVVSINKQAKKLRIRAEPVTVDRTKISSGSASAHG